MVTGGKIHISSFSTKFPELSVPVQYFTNIAEKVILICHLTGLTGQYGYLTVYIVFE